MSKELSPCEECPVRIGYADDTNEGLAADSQHLVPIIGQQAVNRFVNSETATSQEMVDGADRCPGFEKMSKITRTLGKLFTSSSELSYADQLRCQNPVFNNPEWQARVKANRAELEKRINAAPTRKF